jgi:hypothetical protein
MESKYRAKTRNGILSAMGSPRKKVCDPTRSGRPLAGIESKDQLSQEKKQGGKTA